MIRPVSLPLTSMVATIGLLAPLGARAQMPRAPVLQNAFHNQGITAGALFATGSDARVYGLAVAYGRGGWWPQLSGGIGALVPDGGGGSLVAYGARVAFAVPRLLRGESWSVLPFAGIGGASGQDSVRLLTAPIGVAVGYRRAFGAVRGASVYAAPFALWSRETGSGLVETSGTLFRVSAGVDVTLTPKIGVTLGYEGGATAEELRPGPRGGLFGAGISYVFR